MSSNSTDTEVFVYRDTNFILPWVLVAFAPIAAFLGIRAFYLGIRDLNQAKASVWLGPLVQAKSYRLQ